MPAYAIFGATGLCGGAILSHLLSPPHEPSTTQPSPPPDCINLYVRSTRKLTSQNPALLSMPNIHIFSGAITSLDTITSCLLTHPSSSSGPTTTTTPNPPPGDETPPHLVDAIFLALGANENYPGTRINQDAVHGIVAVLTTLRFAHPTLRIPKLVILSSASLNPRLTRSAGPLLHAVLVRALNHVYADSSRAEAFLRLHRGWLPDVTFMTPGALSDDVAQGHRLSFEEVAPFVSYADLGAGFVEVAGALGSEGEEKEMFRWRGVSVLPRREGASAKVEWKSPPVLVRGLVWYYAPAVAGGLAWLGVF